MGKVFATNSIFLLKKKWTYEFEEKYRKGWRKRTVEGLRGGTGRREVIYLYFK